MLCMIVAYKYKVSGACRGELCDSPFLLQNATTELLVHASQVFTKYFMQLLHEIDFSSLFRQGLSAISNTDMNCFACLIG